MVAPGRCDVHLLEEDVDSQGGSVVETIACWCCGLSSKDQLVVDELTWCRDCYTGKHPAWEENAKGQIRLYQLEVACKDSKCGLVQYITAPRRTLAKMLMKRRVAKCSKCNGERTLDVIPAPPGSVKGTETVQESWAEGAARLAALSAAEDDDWGTGGGSSYVKEEDKPEPLPAEGYRG